MVGVPKSTGCFICRKRKIKCDETWPFCLNCQKNGKQCPGPPARHTFRDLGPKLSSTSGSPTPEDNCGIQPQRSKRLTQLNERWSENGAVFQKFRISSKSFDCVHTRTLKTPRRSPLPSASPPLLLRRPSPTQQHELTRSLVDALSVGDAGHRMAAFGPFIREVPARVGQNAALDAAVACLVDAHSSMLRKRRANEVVNPGLYLRAVQLLQTSLENPREGTSTNTLCASVLLGIVEALAGPRVGNRYLAHVGGAGRLLELLGPEKCQEPFAKAILNFNRGGIIITSLYERKTCFLALPEWQDVAFDKADLSFEECLYTEILQRMAEVPALLAELNAIDPGPTDTSSVSIAPDLDCSDTSFDSDSFPETLPRPEYDFDGVIAAPDLFPYPYSSYHHSTYTDSRCMLLYKLQNLRAALCALSEHLSFNLVNTSAAVELPSVDFGCPIRTALHFTNWRVTAAYNCFWSLLILTNKMIMALLAPYDSALYKLEAECRNVALEICKTWEDAWASKPIGAFHTGLSFVLAYEFCTPEVQSWMVRSLNSLLDFQQVEPFRWSDHVIRRTVARMLGEASARTSWD